MKPSRKKLKRKQREDAKWAGTMRALDKRLGAADVPCPHCGSTVHFPPIDGWTDCRNCGKTVTR